MSYILDALRKADAQRERDPTRGINAQSVPPSGATGARSAGPLMWGGIAAAVAVVAVASWYALRSTPPPPVAVVAAPPVMAPVAPAPVAPAPLQPAPPVVTAPMAPIVGAPPAGRTIPPRDPTNTSQPTLRGAQPAPGVIPVVPPSARAADAREAAMAARFGNRPGAAVQQGGPAQSAPGMPAPAPGMSPPAAAAPAPEAAPATGLPPDAPKLAITGGVYSANAAQRMLIVNGQVFNEGSELAPGLVLERVTPKGAVVKFRGANYTVAY